jgi:hypothetical protein
VNDSRAKISLQINVHWSDFLLLIFSRDQLLDCRFPDTTVRQYAVNCLRSISDSELAELLLQFTQVSVALSQFKYLPTVSTFPISLVSFLKFMPCHRC